MANVTIRTRSLSKNRQSLYLDYSPPLFNSSTNKLQRYEFLKLFVYNEPINRIERKHNKETTKLVECIRLKRHLDIQNRDLAFCQNLAGEVIWLTISKSILPGGRKQIPIIWLWLSVTMRVLSVMATELC